MIRLKPFLLIVATLLVLVSTPLSAFAQNSEIVQVEGVTSKIVLIQNSNGVGEDVFFEAIDESGAVESILLQPIGTGDIAYAVVDSGMVGLVYGSESGALYGVVVLDINEDALVRIDGDTKKQDHILDTKHCWGRVVETVSWPNVRPIIKEVLINGTEEPYKGVKKKTWTLVDSDTVTVTYTYGEDGEILISDAWVNE